MPRWGMVHGSLPGEGPQHRVRITKPFYLGTCLVTQGEYQRVMGVNPSNSRPRAVEREGSRTGHEAIPGGAGVVERCGGVLPKAVGDAAGEGGGAKYRLPSEAQWEYACRAGSTGRWSFSPAASGRTEEMEEIREENMLSDYGWFGGNAGGMTHPVGGKRANAWGLYDMHGEVWEWCSDRHGNFDYYAESPTDDPTGSLEGSSRIFRGGGWCFDAGSSRSAPQRQRPRLLLGQRRLPSLSCFLFQRRSPRSSRLGRSPRSPAHRRAGRSPPRQRPPRGKRPQAILART